MMEFLYAALIVVAIGSAGIFIGWRVVKFMTAN
jgi:hypothetical protein